MKLFQFGQYCMRFLNGKQKMLRWKWRFKLQTNRIGEWRNKVEIQHIHWLVVSGLDSLTTVRPSAPSSLVTTISSTAVSSSTNSWTPRTSPPRSTERQGRVRSILKQRHVARGFDRKVFLVYWFWWEVRINWNWIYWRRGKCSCSYFSFWEGPSVGVGQSATGFQTLLGISD